MSQLELKSNFFDPRSDHKVLVVVVDGLGISDPETSLSQNLAQEKGILPDAAFRSGNAVNAALMPNLQKLMSGPLFRTIKAHGPSVGLPSDDDMGNSEVGHNAIGAGRVFAQGAKLINEAIASGKIFEGSAWKKVVERDELRKGTNALHLIGLLSDGNVHSHIQHLFALLEGAKKSGVRKVRLHMLLDGRDVPPKSALEYVDKLDAFLAKHASPTFDCRVASGGGRMVVTMDRYESDWRIVERGYNAHVLGEGQAFSSLREAVEKLRSTLNLTDQNLPAFVIAENGKPVGTMEDGDSAILFNFRGDRAIQISRALTEANFNAFKRKRFPKLIFAGMMQYDGDLKIPSTFLVEPPLIENTSGELLSHAGVKQFACSETQKFGHVTFFWNGNRSGKFNSELETYVEIPSDTVSFSERPWMKSAEITDATIAAMREGSFRSGRINFANGDMVGHTGHFEAAVLSLSCVDLALGRLMEAALETNTTLIVTADHGNADEMFERDKKTGLVARDEHGKPKTKTSHTLSPVPIAIFNTRALESKFDIVLRNDLSQAGLANVASTVLTLLGFEPPSTYEPSLVKLAPKGTVKKDAEGHVAKEAQRRSGHDNFKLANAAIDFAETVHRLRAPDGCPWDREQTFETLARYMIEECYEAVAASRQLSQGRPEASDEFCSELGDVLLQVYLNSEIAKEQKFFAVEDVFKAVNAKMISRHPHVFDRNSEDVKTSDEVLVQWEKLKELEAPSSKQSSLMDKATKKKWQPTLNFASAVAKRSYKVGFAWPTLKEVFGDLCSEVEELSDEIFTDMPDWAKVKDEIGDIGYALSCVTTHLNEKYGQEIDLDLAVRAATEKFLTRFKEMETILREEGFEPTEESVKSIDLGRWDKLWRAAKERRYQ